MIRGTHCVLVAVVLTFAQGAAAQGAATAVRPHRFTFAAGALLATGYPVGDVTAQLRRNAPGAPQSAPLLRAESEIGRATALDARLSFSPTPRLSVEVGGAYSTPRLVVSISQDLEAVEGATASERLSQYAVEVSGIYHLGGIRPSSRARPYVIGGGGYLRQLHEGHVRIETGGTIHGGGGVQYSLRGGVNRHQRPLGARVELRLVHRSGGIEFEEKGRTFPTFSALGFVGF